MPRTSDRFSALASAMSLRKSTVSIMVRHAAPWFANGIFFTTTSCFIPNELWIEMRSSTPGCHWLCHCSCHLVACLARQYAASVGISVNASRTLASHSCPIGNAC
ncbi:hypothetical protein H310_10532 [Aphanomyces invadans]|uniref:Uncharacterized protein n=1 Tax=Aphanomyces invadans TaxID=157072 RepID=A0A024TQV6_9STRA|nr:hypothetical protein H310_10532 [Aphanomyces invadans]ETV96379.1 hypothetical protein H310_10532 [Aphanomyces invadans]|eukprot:XP_008875171.1 hypothetical protein H310_10532 [Aphanomyces invadans]